jgi:hypothetical protein
LSGKRIVPGNRLELGLPVSGDWDREGPHWTCVWLGLGPGIGDLFELSPEHLARLESAAKAVRAAGPESSPVAKKSWLRRLFGG